MVFFILISIEIIDSNSPIKAIFPFFETLLVVRFIFCFKMGRSLDEYLFIITKFQDPENTVKAEAIPIQLMTFYRC